MRTSYPGTATSTHHAYAPGPADAAAAAAAAGNMASVGLDVTGRAQDAAKRLRKGLCPTCGVQTHKVNFFGKRTALSVDGTVLYGQCLKCYPIEGYTKRPQQPTPQSPQLAAQQQPLHAQQHLGGVPPGMNPVMIAQQPYPHMGMNSMPHPPMHQMPGMQPPQLGGNGQMMPPMVHQQMGQHPHMHVPQQPQQQPAPNYPPMCLEVGINDDEDNTVVSGITMDLRLIQGARNWDPDQTPLEYDSDEYDVDVGIPEGGVGAPPLSRRPEASVGGDDPYSDGARPDPLEQMMPRTAAHRGQSGAYGGGRYPSQQYGHHHHYSASARGGERKPPPRAVSPIQEGAYGMDAYGNQYGMGGGDGYGAGRQNGGQVAGLDADGYPISDAAYGWDKQADLLPPGGMDALFNTPVSPRRTNQKKTVGEIEFNFSGEIEFNPAAMMEQAPSQAAAAVPHPPTSEQQRSQSHFHQQAPQPIQQQNRMPSMRSQHVEGHIPSDHDDMGPMFAPDDDEDDDAPASSHLRNRSQVNQRHMQNQLVEEDDHRKYSGNIGAVSEMGNHLRDTSPLGGSDLRGTIDDDMIQDPMSKMTLGPPTTASSAFPPPPNRLRHESSVGLEPPSVSGGLHRDPSGQIVRELPPARLNMATSGNAGAAAGDFAMMGHQHTEFMEHQNMHQTHSNQRDMTPPPHSQFASRNIAPSSPPAPPPPQEKVREMYRRLSDRRDPPSGSTNGQDSGVGSGGPGGKEHSVTDIPVILHCLNLAESNAFLREKAFQSLTEIVWKSGDKAKAMFAQYKGIDTLVNNMWSDMGDAKVQDAAAQFLFALAASTDGSASNDVLSNEEATSDALLFSMQSHMNVESIQLTGCGILSCLAAASANNKAISDGSLSGALTIVLSAMFNHSNSKGVQKAGLQALYSQCALSTNAESNKRSLVGTQLDGGATGLSVIIRAIELLQNELVSLEWAFKLCWCLTSSEDLAKALTETPDVIPLVVETCHRYLETPAAGVLVEASFGILGNLAHLDQNRTIIHNAGALKAILDGMKFHRNMAGVSVEGCAALANLGVAPRIRQDMIRMEAAKAVVSSMQSFLDNPDAVEEACRTLVVMSIENEEAKAQLIVPQVLSTVSEASERHENNSSVQEMVSCLVASLAVSTSPSTSASRSDILVQQGGVDIVVRALGSSKEEKVLEAATNAYRNLACQAEQTDRLLKGGAARKLVKAMAANENSIEIQMNSCCSLWNLACKVQERSKKPEATRDIVDTTGVKCIVKAMQSHMESGDLLELACGALWSLVDDSLELKKDVVGSGAIDAVACALVMHPTRTTTLEKACGVLANVSVEGPLAEAIANAQAVSIVVEAMRNNGSSIPFLEIGSLLLRNLVVQFPDFAEEASGAVSTVINAMKDNPKAVSFQREACSLLWILAAVSENCESKILALDGISVLMKSLEHNSDVPDVQEAALSAFKQLATSAQ